MPGEDAAPPELEGGHLLTRARELADAAGVPLRDRYGYDAPDRVVRAALAIIAAEPDDDRAAAELGVANFTDGLGLAMGYDQLTDEDYERQIVTALRPLTGPRVAAGRPTAEGSST